TRAEPTPGGDHAADQALVVATTPHSHEGAPRAMTEQRRVVVTGLGATTPMGGTAPQTWEAVLAGRSGARTMPFEWVQQYELPVTFAATIHTDPGEVLTKVEVRRNDPSG